MANFVRYLVIYFSLQTIFGDKTYLQRILQGLKIEKFYLIEDTENSLHVISYAFGFAQ